MLLDYERKGQICSVWVLRDFSQKMLGQKNKLKIRYFSIPFLILHWFWPDKKRTHSFESCIKLNSLRNDFRDVLATDLSRMPFCENS